MPEADSWEQKECFLQGCYASEALSKAGTWEQNFLSLFPSPNPWTGFFCLASDLYSW